MIQKNWVEILAWAISISLAGGSFLMPIEMGGISFYLFRVLVLIGGITGATFFFKSYFQIEKSQKLFFIVLMVWLILGASSYFYVLGVEAWLKDIFYLLIGFAVFFSLYLIFSRNKEEKFLYGWITGYFCNIIFGFYEMLTGSHFAGDMTNGLSELSHEHYVHFSPAGFFGNSNHYAFYLVLSFLMFVFFRKKINSTLQLFLFVPGVWQLFQTYSKFSIIAFLLILLYWIMYGGISKKSRNKDVFVSIISGVLFFGVFIISLKFDETTIVNPSEHSRTESQKLNPDLRPESTDLRLSLIKNGWQFISETKGIGIGAGQFSVYILKGKGKYDCEKLRSPHNGIIEIASQYGLIVLAIIISFYFWWFKSLLLLRENENTFFALLCLSSIFILSNVNSGFMASPLSWFVLILPIFWLPIRSTRK